jgi:enamine deaminase RidA (YjgF/YER057c/UK114 family)
MRIEHPYSLLVRADDLAWSCGQCPLAPDGSVLAPDDLVQQAHHVESYIERLLRKAGLARESVGKLVVYHAPSEPALVERMLSRFRMSFPDALLIPVGTPFFYYPGMRLEVDVHAAAHRAPIVESTAAPGLRIAGVDVGELIWVNLEVLADPDGSRVHFADALDAAVGVSPNALIADHWFVAGEGASSALKRLQESGFVTDPGAAVGVTLRGGVVAMGELTFARGKASSPLPAMPPQSETPVFARLSGHHFWIAARSASLGLSLVEQTKAIMASVTEAMRAQGWTFDAICKATTHYVGSSAAGDLHDNMTIRNAHYRRPGPASTGLPVAAFPFSPTKIAVDMLGVID